MKTMTLYRPNAGKILSDFDRYIDSFFGASTMTSRDSGYLPPVDIWETNEAYHISMELPGRDEKAVQISVEGRTLTIAAEPGDAGKEKKEENRYLIRERASGSFSRSFQLPEDADPESVTADYKEGLLGMKIVKRSQSQKRQITIGGER
jgi:HSP20 family protein